MYRRYGSIVALLFLLASGPAAAGNYWGGSYGQADVDTSGFDTSSAFKIFGGIRAGMFGFEGAYVDMSGFDVIGSTSSVSVDGIEMSGVVYHNLAALTLFAKAGLFFWNATASTAGLPWATDEGSDITFGFGALYDLSASPLSLRAEYQIFQDVSGGDIDMWSVGLQYNF